MKKLFFLLFSVVILIGLGCSKNDSGTNPEPDNNEVTKNLEGYWEGILPDGDFDGYLDENIYYYIFLDITSHNDRVISGHYYQQVGDTLSDDTLTGTSGDGEFQFSTIINNDTITFSGYFASTVVDYEKGHFIADWTTSSGHSGSVIFVAVDSHIVPEETSDNLYTKSLPTLTKDGGSGQPIIFVHGWNSNIETWNSMINRFQSDGYFDHYEFWRFGYSSDQSIENIAQQFYNLVSDNDLLDRSPVIVAHSMGGIVARKYITLGGTFSQLIALSSPHAGTPLSIFGTNESGRELTPCSSTLQSIFNYENDHDVPFSNYAVVSGKITGGWKWVVVRQYTVWGHTVDVWGWLWEFDRNYDTWHKSEWVAMQSLGYSSDNDGVVPTCSENFYVIPGSSPGYWPCAIDAPIDYDTDKHLTNYDHSMVLEPSESEDVYSFIIDHLP